MQKLAHFPTHYPPCIVLRAKNNIYYDFKYNINSKKHLFI